MSIIKRFIASSFLLLAMASYCYANIGIEDLSIQEQEDLEKFLLVKKGNNKPRAIDLTIPEHERGYIALLRLHGITKASDPEWFKEIELLKQEQKAAHKNGNSIEIPDNKDTPSSYHSWPAFHYEHDRTKVTASISGTQYYPDYNYAATVFATLMVYAKLDNGKKKQIASGYKKVSGKDVRYFEVNTDVLYGRNKAKECEIYNNISKYKIYAVTTGIYSPPSGNRYLVLINTNDTGLVDTDNDKEFPETLENIAPVKKDGDKNKAIVVCLNKTYVDGKHPAQCDYVPVYNKPAQAKHVLLPVVGSATFKELVLAQNGKPEAGLVPPHDVSLTLFSLDTGGVCQIHSDEFMRHVIIDRTGKKLSWDFSGKTAYADFGQACWKENNTFMLELQGFIVTNETGSEDSGEPEADAKKNYVRFHFTGRDNFNLPGLQNTYQPIIIQ
ncbi:hypothetical protein FE392_06120 [Xenorhabdus sp. 12]|uniref:Uncharacterized protein n=1 Tax=Xenorhabdus santafensis TaxID=2582833 RepID=A0ABU4S7Z5_9GAMM|nr:hypothetical protein [Xenorhabdus sp. 12]MDX7986908.1 hypothetical protein [Xenorhabdus sp. 12]